MKFGKPVALGALVLALAVPALAQSRTGAFSPSLRLLALPEVRTELKLTAEQSEKISKLQRGMKDRLVTTLRNLQNVPTEERRKKFDGFRSGVDREVVEILDPAQRKRLRELELQQEGPRALLDPAFAAELRLSNTQNAKLRTLVSKERDKLRELASAQPANQEPSPEERAKITKQVEEIRKETDAELLKVLSAEQRTRFTVLQGQPFKFPERRTAVPVKAPEVKPAAKPAAAPAKKK